MSKVFLHHNYKETTPTERSAIYKSQLMVYASEIVAKLCTKRSDQWQLLSYIDPGALLFTFHDHQRLCFSKRAGHLTHKFRTSMSSRRLSHYSFRVLWIVQSPLFEEKLKQLIPEFDYGTIYLTYDESISMFSVKLSWDSGISLSPTEKLVQVILSCGENEQHDEQVIDTTQHDLEFEPEPEPDTESESESEVHSSVFVEEIVCVEEQ